MRAVGLGQDQHEAVEGARDRRVDHDAQAGERLLAQHQVGAAAGAQPHLVDEVAGPDAGGVDDRAGGDGVRRRRSARRAAAPTCRSRRARGPGCARARRTTRRCGPPSSPGGRRPRAGRPSRASPPRSPWRRSEGASSQRLGAGEVTRARQGLHGWCAHRGAACRRPRSPRGPRPPGGRGTVEPNGISVGIAWVRCGAVTSMQEPALDGALVGDADLADGQVAEPAVHAAWRTTATCRRRGRGRRRRARTGRGSPRRGRRRRR